MTADEIIEWNKLIASFQGSRIRENGDILYFHFEEPKSINNDFYHKIFPSELRYNIYWDWLIPVCEQIESIKDEFHGYFGVYIHSNCCTIQGSKLNTSVENFHPAYFLESYGDTKIEAVYLAVIQFIKFWNDQKRKDS